jgi:hypothetical protein
MTKLKTSLIDSLRDEALRRSRNQVKALLKSKGTKLSDWTRADLNRAARVWLDGHRQQVVGAVLGDLLSERCVNLLSAARQAEAHSAGLSHVQMSRTLEDAK